MLLHKPGVKKKKKGGGGGGGEVSSIAVIHLSD